MDRYEPVLQASAWLFFFFYLFLACFLYRCSWEISELFYVYFYFLRIGGGGGGVSPLEYITQSGKNARVVIQFIRKTGSKTLNKLTLFIRETAPKIVQGTA